MRVLAVFLIVLGIVGCSRSTFEEDQNKKLECKDTFKKLIEDLRAHQSEDDKYPKSLRELASQQNTIDPWGRRIRYSIEETDDGLTIHLISPGQDGLFGTRDDVFN